MRKIKLKAGALLYVIAVALVVGLITAGLLLWAYSERLSFNKLIKQDQLIRNARSGMAILMSLPADEVLVKKRVDLFDDGEDFSELTRIPWGMFQLSHSVAVYRSYRFALCAITGVAYKELPALYLPNNGDALSLVGSARIDGNVYMSDAGLKRIYIQSYGPGGGGLLNGNRYNSKKDLIEWVVNTPINLSAIADSIIQVGETEFADTVYGSIDKGLFLIASANALHISAAAVIKGAVAISSRGAVTIDKDAKLENVLIQAPSVVFKSNFKGSAHVIATDSIVIKSGAHLNYPSSMVISAAGLRGYIRLEEKSSLSGGLAVFSDNTGQSQIYIKKGALVNGLVYSKGNITLQGQVEGSVICTGFYLKTESSTYTNVILDGQISTRTIHEQYVFPDGLAYPGQKEVVEWIR